MWYEESLPTEKMKKTEQVLDFLDEPTVTITPAAARLMEQHGIAVEDIPGTPQKITVREVQLFINQNSANNGSN